MSAIRFDVIKRNAGRILTDRMMVGSPFPSEAQFLALYGAMCGPKPSDPRKLLDEWHNKGRQIIEAWDVRRASKLIDLFPGCVPANWNGKQLSAYMADTPDCDWIVEAA